MSMIRVFLCDNHRPFRAALTQVLEALGGIEVVGEAGVDGMALDPILTHCPDVVIIGVSPPHFPCLDLAQQVRLHSPLTRILFTGGFQDEEATKVALSPREKEVLNWVAQGFSASEIALCISVKEQTVKNHLASIRRKLALADRTQAVQLGCGQG